MSMVSPDVQDLARRLMAFEAERRNSSEPHVDVAMRVIAKLRLCLMKLAGVDGFRSLLTRALTLAKAEIPALNIVNVRADGSVEGFDGIVQSGVSEVTGSAGMILVAHLLDLLMTFIGEPLTLRLVQDTWPDAPVGTAESTAEEKT